MNKLGTDERVAVIRALVEGCSVRSTSRMTGIDKKAILRLLVSMGRVCRKFHDEAVRGLSHPPAFNAMSNGHSSAPRPRH